MWSIPKDQQRREPPSGRSVTSLAAHPTFPALIISASRFGQRPSMSQGNSCAEFPRESSPTDVWICVKFEARVETSSLQFGPHRECSEEPRTTSSELLLVLTRDSSRPRLSQNSIRIDSKWTLSRAKTAGTLKKKYNEKNKPRKTLAGSTVRFACLPTPR